MNGILYDILWLWPGKPETPGEIAPKFLRSLDALAEIDPRFSNWGTCDHGDLSGVGRPVDPIRRDFANFIESHVWRDDWDQPDPGQGYGVFAANDYHAHAEPDGRTTAFEVTAGSTGRNFCKFDIGRPLQPPDPADITYPVFKSVLLDMLPIWPSVWACATCSVWGKRPAEASSDMSFPYSRFQMPWIAYLNAEHSGGVTVPANVETERTLDGGLLMSATKDRLEPGNPAHMAASKAIVEIMIGHAGSLGF